MTDFCSMVFRATSARLTRLARHWRTPEVDSPAALLIDVPDEEVVRRLAGRRVCLKSGHVYHVEFDPPKREGICDQDGSRLVQREDDKEDTIRRRLEVYARQTAPLIDVLRKCRTAPSLRRSACTIPDEVHDHIRADASATLRMEDELAPTR